MDLHLPRDLMNFIFIVFAKVNFMSIAPSSPLPDLHPPGNKIVTGFFLETGESFVSVIHLTAKIGELESVASLHLF